MRGRIQKGAEQGPVTSTDTETTFITTSQAWQCFMMQMDLNAHDSDVSLQFLNHYQDTTTYH